MSTITIHGLPAETEKKLRNRAKQLNKSLNMTIKELLEASLAPGYSEKKRQRNRKMFEEFFDTWTAEESKAFDEGTADFGNVDMRDWE